MKDGYGRDWVANADGWYSPVPERTPASDAAALRRQAEWEAARPRTEEETD